MKIVKIRWRDSNQELYQREVTDLLRIEEIETVGFLLSETPDSVVVSRDLLNDQKDCRGMITIPRENIITLAKLK